MLYIQPTTAAPQFYIYPKRKSTLHPNADMYLQISYDRVMVHKSLGIKVAFENWNSAIRQIEGYPILAMQLQQKIEEFTQKVMGAFYMLTQQQTEFTLPEMLDLAFGSDKGRTYTLFALFNQELIKMEKLLKEGQSKSNLQKHKSVLNHLKIYVKEKYRMNDIPFSRINRSFIDDFEVYLKTTGGNNHNASNKNLQIFKKIYRIAVDNRWTAHNAFAGKRMFYQKVDRPFLNASELDILRTTVFKSKKQEHMRDIFVFSCYTGLAYIDVVTIQRKHILFNKSMGQYFINKKREKTKILATLPLFKPALEILNKYAESWESYPSDSPLLSVISNQKYNDYLKEVGAFCNLEKSLTSHMARHTFATTVTLENGVSIESVSKMLGHSKLSQTQEYAKVTEIKIEKDTRQLYANLL